MTGKTEMATRNPKVKNADQIYNGALTKCTGNYLLKNAEEQI